MRAPYALAAGLIACALLGSRSLRAQEIVMSQFSERSGEEIFRNICQGCHMPDARGATGAGTYPALAGNRKLAAAVYPVTVLLHGQRAMPTFADSLDDEQIASVLNYVRSHFGNRYRDRIEPEMVRRIRAAR